MAKVRVRKETSTLYIDFSFRGVRCREQTALSDTKANQRLLEQMAKKIDAEITLGTFDYAKTFPNSKRAIKFATPVPTPTGKVAAGVLPSGVVTPLFKVFSLEWYEEREVGWKRSYREKLMDMLNLYLHPAFGEKRVSDITKADILKFRASLAKVEPGKEKGRSASRINQVTNLLKQIVDEAADRYDFNTPYRGIKPLRIGRTEVDPFSLEEVQLFLENVDPAWRDYFVVRFFSGMRTSEIDGLKWKYVDFDRREIYVKETVVHGHEDTTKTGGSERVIQMSSVVFEALKAQFEVTGSIKKDGNGFVFANRYGSPYQYRNVNYRIWYPTLKKCQLKRRRPYQTRHTAATLWLAAGESPEWIARQMGHTNTKMLFTVYSRYVPNLTRQDGSAMDRLLRGRFGSGESVCQQ